MDIERYLDYRKRVQRYVLSMTIFKSHYLNGALSEELYEIIELVLTNKYNLHRMSAIRHTFQLNQYKKDFYK